jgi:superfamily II DNA/RNA helicase
MQVHSIAKDLSHYAKLRIRKVVGGDKGKSLINVFKSKIDILITTPDRCLRAFNNNELSAANLKYFIFDEADQLLEPSFKATVGEIAKKLTRPHMRIYLVSASRPLDFDKIVADFFPGKTFTTIGKGEENVLNHKVDTYNLSVEEDDKFIFVNEFIKKQGKRNGLIFMGNKARSKKLFEQVRQEFGNKKIFLLHKDLEAKERTAVVSDFRKSGGILVATDIFSRGIDISHLQWVLNFDLPSEADYYLHRSGRVGRAGRPGDVFNFITSRDTKRQKNINAILGNQGRSDLQILGKMIKLASQ